MPEVAVALRAEDLRAAHPVAGIEAVPHRILRDGLVERGPTGAGLELRVGREEGVVAGHAVEHALLVDVEQGRAERRLRAVAAQDRVLLLGEPLLPLGFREHELVFPVRAVDRELKAGRRVRRVVRGDVLRLFLPFAEPGEGGIAEGGDGRESE